MKRVTFDLALTVLELSNVPLLDDNFCYMVVTVSSRKPKNNYKRYSRSKVTTRKVPISHHKVQFRDSGKLRINFRFKVASDNVTLADKWLSISFIASDNKGLREGRLGAVYVNLAQYASQRQAATIKYLLDHSKMNAIAKLTLQLNSMEPGPAVPYRASSKSVSNASRSVLGTISSTLETSSAPRQSSECKKSIMSGSSLLSSSPSSESYLNLPNSPGSRQDVSSLLSGVKSIGSGGGKPKRMGVDSSAVHEICDEAFNQDDLLNAMINRTYRLTWSTQDKSYLEYSPAECVRDIVEYNGNGWRKDDEGLTMMDVIKGDIKENAKRRRHFKKEVKSPVVAPIKITIEEPQDTPVVDDSGDSTSSEELSDEIGEEVERQLSDQLEVGISDVSDEASSMSSFGDTMEHIKWGNSRHHHTKATEKKVRRLSPPSEAQARENLRSWRIKVSDENAIV